LEEYGICQSDPDRVGGRGIKGPLMPGASAGWLGFRAEKVAGTGLVMKPDLGKLGQLKFRMSKGIATITQ
jgi:hypothetical protein